MKNRLLKLLEEQNADVLPDPGRRRLLQASGLGVAGLAAGGTLLSPAPARAVQTSARIVIVGGGAAGLSAANRLASGLSGANITIIEKREQHTYQPGLTLVATGIWNQRKVLDRNERYMPSGINWIKGMVSEFDPEANRVVTDSGQVVEYDYLMVTTGLHVDFAAIEGMSAELIGREGIGCVYDNSDHATRTWQMIDRFANEGGIGLFTRPVGGIKCAGAPLKVTMLTEDLMQRRGTRERGQFFYPTAGTGLFSQPDMNDFLKQEFPSRDINVQWNHVLAGIEPERKRATFTTPEGNVRLDYDFIHVVPPMRAPDALANSALAWQAGSFADDGRWMEVDKHTMRHPRFPNVFGAGDCVGTPIGKTAASVKAQVPVAVENMIQAIQQGEMTASYNGYTSCPLITARGRGILVEFDYALDMVPSFPFISPYEEHWVPWVMKDRMLHAAYNAMMRGRV
ncbi:MAG: NAD(P)/FAD-dependent oxidoreductase [Wenzhouxiangella sp.]